MKLLKNLKSPIFRVIIIGILITTILGIVVKAGNVQIQNITIKYANGSETNIITSKTKVSEIIEENHIVILEDETVIPSLDDEIEEDKTIRIVKKEENISKKSNVRRNIVKLCTNSRKNCSRTSRNTIRDNNKRCLKRSYRYYKQDNPKW